MRKKRGLVQLAMLIAVSLLLSTQTIMGDTMRCSDMPSPCRPLERGCKAGSIVPYYYLCYFECWGEEFPITVWCIDDN